MRPLTIVKVWYQNDFGRFGRRDERLCRALLEDPRVARVIHVEPPLPRRDGAVAGETSNAAASSGDPADERLVLFTPTYAQGASDPWREVLEQTARFLAAHGVFAGPSLLWVSAPGALGDRIVATMGARFRWIVTEVEDDHRRWCAERSDEQLAVARRYERAVRASDLLISNSQAMVDDFSRWQRNALRVGNAVDLAPYASPREPSCLAPIARPRLVYVGNLRLRLRPELFAALTDTFPKATLVLAGDDDGWLRSQLGSRDNVRFVGRVAPDAVPGLLVHSDVLLLPHATGPVTDAMDPQKLYEYLASGRPIVATPVAGARDFGDVVALANDPKSFVSAVAAALEERTDDAAARERRVAKVRGRTWLDAAKRVVDAALAVKEPGARLRAEQSLGYFQHERPEVRALVPPSARRVLDVGCGAGALGAALQFQRGVEVVGIELDAKAAERARESLDRVLVGDALEKLRELATEAERPDRGDAARFDAILFADLLEHLAEPQRALELAAKLLTRDGVVVASLPNVRHWSVVRQLLEGDFKYEPAGILDRTHLRFFTKRSARRLFEEHGFAVEREQGVHWNDEPIPPSVVAALASTGLAVGGLAEESREHQWLLVARPVVAVTQRDAAAQPAASARPAASVASPLAAPAVSVVIPVCNAADYTRGCLDELRARGGGGLEVIVVDNGSTDHTARVLADHAEVRVVRNAQNRGFAAAVNQGLHAARAPIVCVLNNDTLLTDGWLAPMTRLLEREPSVGLVGPCTSYAKGRQQVNLLRTTGESRRRTDEPSHETTTAAAESFTSVEQMRELAARWCEHERGRVEDVSFLSGFCFVARRADLLPIGGLADAYGRGTFEDDELCRALRRRGLRLLIARDSYVHHFGNRTFQALGVDLKAQQEQNWKRFAERHRGDAGMLARIVAQQADVEAATSPGRGAAPSKWSDVLKLAHAAMKSEPRDLDALWFAALATARFGRERDALRLVEHYLGRCPSDPLALGLKRDCERARDRETVSEELAATRNELRSGGLVGV